MCASGVWPNLPQTTHPNNEIVLDTRSIVECLPECVLAFFYRVEYTTEEDWQTSVDIEIYEGERGCTDANNKLGEFRIEGLQRAKRGEPEVAVTFSIDVNGILQVSAEDQKTGAKASTTISNTRGRLSQEEIDQMIADAEEFKADDQRKVELIEAKNELDQIVYDAKSRGGFADEEALQTLRDVQAWMEDNADASLEAVRAKRDEVRRVFYR